MPAASLEFFASGSGDAEKKSKYSSIFFDAFLPKDPHKVKSLPLLSKIKGEEADFPNL